MKRSLHDPHRVSPASARRRLAYSLRVEQLEPRQLMAVDSILEWNGILLDANVADYDLAAPEQPGPILSSRAFAIVSAAMYDALNSIENIGQKYLVTAPLAKNADVDAAVAQAAHDTLIALYPSQAATFDAALQASLAAIPDSEGETRGRAVGSYVAERILTVRATDGSDTLGQPIYEPNGLPGFHDVDPLHPNQGFYGSAADAMKTFAIPTLDKFQSRRLDDGTPEGRLAFLQSQEYAAAYDEVLRLGGDGIDTPTERTDEQTEIGIYWGYDGRPGLGTPVRLYNQIARTIAVQQNNAEAQNARLFALLNIAMADAGMTAWNGKYDDAFWRPILGIRNGEIDGNAATAGDVDWQPLGASASNPLPGETNFTPSFPAYTSGHATFGAAVFETLARFYQRDDIAFTFMSDELNGITTDADGEVRPVATRSFDTLSEAKLENAKSRIYLGVHWAFDATEGIKTGDQVADYVYENTLKIYEKGNRPHRHNQNNPVDVNDDGVCSTLDVLVIINEMRRSDDGSENFADVNNDGTRTPLDVLMVINRLKRDSAAKSAGLSGAGELKAVPQLRAPSPVISEVRSYDGTGNNLANPDWGSAGEALLRKSQADYADGISAPAGADRPSAREISNALSSHIDEATPNDRDLTAYLYVWGQFLDHDLDLTGAASPSEAFNIAVPVGDASFDPLSLGNQVVPLKRSAFDPSTGSTTPREQVNQITAWIDGSMIYSSDATRAAALRAFTGGRLKVSDSAVSDLLPLNTDGLPNANDAHRVPDNQLFLAGDIRSNENVELTALHTLFLREHNRLADRIAAQNSSLSDEEIFQRARAFVIAELQVITYKEWLPALLGSNGIRAYRGYQPAVNPGISNEFSTAAFRLHSTINDDVEFFDNDGLPIQFTYVNERGESVVVDGGVALSEAFSNPNLFTASGLDGILKYAASTHAEEFDTQIVESLRNFLFGQPGQGGLDLASLNIQRGRDHGLADYNAVRQAYGLAGVTSFSEITSDVALQQKLESLYGTVDNIDLWVGIVAEDHLRGASVGPLARAIIADQFQRLRDGDRFWYQRTFGGRELAELERTKLSDIIERNTGVSNIQDNVFVFQAEVSGMVYLDLNANGRFDRTERPLSGVTLELLDDAGEAIATTVTRRDGRYSFSQFPETGDFAVRLVEPSDMVVIGDGVKEILVSRGGLQLRGVNFGLTRKQA